MPHLRKAVKTVYLRQVSSEQWEKVDLVDKDQPETNGMIKLEIIIIIFSKTRQLIKYKQILVIRETD